ncbi:MAG: serine/threonine-protein kinase [Rikenellaceae bacterium]
MSSSEFFTTPTILNQYTGFEVISSSGFNTLYLVERDGKKFIVKALLELYRGDMLYESLLRKEFEIGYSFDHANICRTVNFEQFPDIGNAIVMEWIDGRTLNEYIKEKKHSPKELQRIIEQLCDALSYAHKRQTIHRDLKPQNIIITHNGDNLKLLDFGLSDTDYYTALKEPAGSRRYASPELLRGEKVDSRSDIYSLGVIINELFEGQRTRRISKVVSRATSYYASSRYADVETVVAALKNRQIRLVYPILAAILVAIIYLFYTMNRATESLIPSAEADGVTTEEFERRQALCNDFYSEINNIYLDLMNNNVNRINCATPEMPNFDELSNSYLKIYQNVLDSMLGTIKSSSLYSNARRNMVSHNRELFTLMRNGSPSTFWVNTESMYTEAKDSLALELKKLPAPKYVPNFSELNYEEREDEIKRYNKAVQEYKKTTVEVWAIAYRERNNLSPISTSLLGYYK